MEESVRKDILRKIRRATKHDWSRLEEALSRSFRQLEQHGFCLVSGMLRPEVTAIGAPLVDPRSRNIFSFSCTVIGHPPAQSLFEDEIGPKLLATVQRVATSLGAR
jgi:DNA-binding IclR family transcriptional regulator